MDLELDKKKLVNVWGGQEFECEYFVTHKDNIYKATVRVNGLDYGEPALHVTEVRLPEKTDEETLSAEAMEERLQEFFDDKR